MAPGDRAALASVNEVWHLAASTSFDERSWTRYARAMSPERATCWPSPKACPNSTGFVYVSTAYVAGTNPGPIPEDEMPVRNGFRNSYESTKWEAEAVCFGILETPFVDLLRRASFMGDSQTFNPQCERRMS